MGLFDKKYCDFCGEKIGLLGNRKLEDGNMCKDCAAKLSPWLTGRKHETVEAIREHLKYREENRQRLSDFRVSRVLGKATKIYIDDGKGCFIISRRENWLPENPDIISIGQVLSCEIPVTENKRQLYTRDKEGRQVPYDPPRYEYSYSFDVKLTVDSPYFSEIRFDLSSDTPDSRNSYAYALLVYEGQAIQHALMPGTYGAPVKPIEGERPHRVMNRKLEDAAAAVGAVLLERIEEQRRTEEDVYMSETVVPYENAGPAAVQTAPAAGNERWFCPECGTANEGNFCMKCGAKKPVPIPRCSKCGFMPEKDSIPNFCPVCGTKFGE